MDENKLKNFLINGFQKEDHEEEQVLEGTETVEPADICGDAETCGTEEYDTGGCPEDMTALAETLKGIENEMIRIRYDLSDLKAEADKPAPDMSQYLTTRELMKSVTAAVSKRDAEAANKTLVRAMEAISVMREDFFKLCQGMKGRIDDFSAETVLSSFEAYSVDMENILTDGGVFIGAFPYDRLNTLHQRIVGVVPTDDAEKDGMIADRHSDGYKMGDKVLLKEKVSVYRYDPKMAASGETASETSSKTASKKSCETASEPAGRDPAAGDAISMEEEE